MFVLVLALLPLALLFGGGLLLLLLDVFNKNFNKQFIVVGTIFLGSLISSYFNQEAFVAGRTIFSGMMYLDPFSWYSTTLIISGTLLSLIFFESVREQQGINSPTEVYTLFLFSSVGAALFANSSHFLSLFLGLEIMSISLYCLCGSVLKGPKEAQSRSVESSLKYFLLGSFSSAFLLYGLALLYGATGSLAFSDIYNGLIQNRTSPLISLALGITLVGFFFKVGVIPYHFWLPDVYQGAPTSVTGYMASVIKGAAFCALLRFLWVGFGGDLQTIWIGAMWCIAALSMVGGNLIALRQRDVKRMLAYSSIAHGGYLITALLSTSQEIEGATALLYYLVVYALMTLGSFASLQLVTKNNDASGVERSTGDDISNLRGAGFSHPFAGVAFSLCLLSLAGLPPAIAGVTAKLFLLTALIKSNYIGLALIAVLSSAMGCYYYLKVIATLYTRTQDVAPPLTPLSHSARSIMYNLALFICVASTIVFGIRPSLVYDRASVIMASFVLPFH